MDKILSFYYDVHMAKINHLHTHSHYSLLQALPKIPELIEIAKKNEMKTLALTDNGNLYGTIEFYKLYEIEMPEESHKRLMKKLGLGDS